MDLKKFLFGKKAREKETIASILKKTGRIKGLEKKHAHLREMIREAERDRNELATRIMKLETKIKRMERK